MKVLFTGFFPRWLVHFVTELDFIERHIEAGDSVSLLMCNGELGTCECNRYRVDAGCADCIGRRQHGLSLLSRHVRTLPLLAEIPVPQIIPSDLKSVEELKSIKVGDFDIGEAIYSSLIDRCYSTSPDLKAESRTINTMARDSYRIWKTALVTLQREHFDRVYIFNGRFSTTRAWVRACQSMQVPFFTHERSMKSGKVFLVDGSLPHDPTTYKQRIDTFVEETCDKSEAWNEGIEFFEERMRGENSAWKVFTGQQNQGELPSIWNPARRNIAFFASTEREFVGVKQFTPPWIYDSQLEALLDLIPKAVNIDKSLMFYLRIHPNSGSEKIRWWEFPEIKSLSNVCIVPPESSVSTYALMSAVEKAVCFHSSMGIEASYWGKPSIVLGRPFYIGIDAVYEPCTREEALEMVVTELQSKSRENAIKYGAFMRCGGIQLHYADPLEDVGQLKFKGVNLTANEEVKQWTRKSFDRSSVAGIRWIVRKSIDLLHWNFLRTKYKNWFADTPFNSKNAWATPEPEVFRREKRALIRFQAEQKSC